MTAAGYPFVADLFTCISCVDGRVAFGAGATNEPPISGATGGAVVHRRL
jgi:hypothetical protein